MLYCFASRGGGAISLGFARPEPFLSGAHGFHSSFDAPVEVTEARETCLAFVTG
jgi:hypothetical protein